MAGQTSITLFVILSSVILVLLIFVIVFFVLVYTNRVNQANQEFNEKKLKMEAEGLRDMVESIESEKKRIAKDLHDDIGPMLSILKMKLLDFGKVKNENEKLNKSFVTQNEIIDSISTKIKTSCHNLSPSVLVKYGLDSALEQFTGSLGEEEDFTLTGFEKSDERLPESVEVSLYRIITELINNAIKYSNGKAFQLEKKSLDTELVYSFKYVDGIGISNEDFDRLRQNSTSFGMKSIYERLNFINASIHFQEENNIFTTSIITKVNEN